MTDQSGKLAEEKAANYLEERGYKIVANNWRTRFCEIDIIAQKDNCMYFIEVKYRRNQFWGAGLEYITHTKQKQMKFAAEMWINLHEWEGESSLGAIEVEGEDFIVSSFLPEL